MLLHLLGSALNGKRSQLMCLLYFFDFDICGFGTGRQNSKMLPGDAHCYIILFL